MTESEEVNEPNEIKILNNPPLFRCKVGEDGTVDCEPKKKYMIVRVIFEKSRGLLLVGVLNNKDKKVYNLVFSGIKEVHLYGCGHLTYNRDEEVIDVLADYSPLKWIDIDRYGNAFVYWLKNRRR